MDIYAIVTDKIINLLENGVVPWRRPWTSTGLPRNLVSKKPYRGVNLFLLSASKYVSPFWLTMRQANELGGHVRKGEESTDRRVLEGRRREAEHRRPRQRRDRREDAPSVPTSDTIGFGISNNANFRKPSSTSCRRSKRTSTIRSKRPNGSSPTMPNPPEIQHAGSKAFYSPITDRITLPPRELFASAEEYYATALHETVHSTGSQKRLAREGICEAAPFGSAVYSKEELVRGNGSRLSLRRSRNLNRCPRESSRLCCRLAEEASRRSQASDSRRRPGPKGSGLYS